MSNESVDTIIAKIKKIKIARTKVDLESEEVEKQQQQLKQEKKRLESEEDSLFEQLRLKRSQEQERSTTTNTKRTAGEQVELEPVCKFSKGDKVFITNKISIPKSRKENEGDRKATVQYILYDRVNIDKSIVYIKTYNGFETRRNAEYLRHQFPQR